MAARSVRPLSTVSSTTTHEEDDEQVSENVRKQTEIMFFEYVDSYSQHDHELTCEQVSMLHNSASCCIRNTQRNPQQEEIALKLANILRNYGDEFQSKLDNDTQLQEVSLQAISTDGGNPDPSFITSHLMTVVRAVFDIDENGVAHNINIGRIASVFYYCYSLCKKFLKTVFANHSLIEFLVSLTGFLIATFIKVRFFDWLNSHGGWGQIMAKMFSDNVPAWTNNALLAGGVFLLTLWGYRWYRGLT
jgi:hypothetical protein